jgi:hypothetical protein
MVVIPRVPLAINRVPTTRPKTPAISRPKSLKAAHGKLVIRDPDQQQRARYRGAIHRLITTNQIPEGFGLRHTGRDRDDLTIRLTALPDDPKRPDPPSRVPVPHTMDEVTPSVMLLGEQEQLAVTPDALDRALRIAQAIANECTARSWTFAPNRDSGRGFRIIAGECTFNFTLTEKLLDREVHDNESLQAAKYPWQRISCRWPRWALAG